MRRAARATPDAQTDARSILTIWADPNERARTFSASEMHCPVGDALRHQVSKSNEPALPSCITQCEIYIHQTKGNNKYTITDGDD